MGGFGSGNGGAPRRVAYTKDAPCLDAVQLKAALCPGAQGRLAWGQCSMGVCYAGGGTNGAHDTNGGHDDAGHGPCVLLSGTVKGTGAPWSQLLTLVSIRSCGAASGDRSLLLCPLCSKRRRSLYFWKGRFLCRECHGLKYPTKSLSPLDRAYSRLARVARKIDPAADATDWPTRPPGMQRRTFHKLRQRWRDADQEREELADRELMALCFRYGWGRTP